jgi:hypothetical protein
MVVCFHITISLHISVSGIILYRLVVFLVKSL